MTCKYSVNAKMRESYLRDTRYKIDKKRSVGRELVEASSRKWRNKSSWSANL